MGRFWKAKKDFLTAPGMKGRLMEPLTLFMITVGILVLFYVIKFSMGGIPKASQQGNNEFKKSIPEGFGDYVYFLDGSGVAFNIPENKFFLQQNGVAAYMRKLTSGMLNGR